MDDEVDTADDSTVCARERSVTHLLKMQRKRREYDDPGVAAVDVRFARRTHGRCYYRPASSCPHSVLNCGASCVGSDDPMSLRECILGQTVSAEIQRVRI